MLKEERSKIIQGLVRHRGFWISLEEKARLEAHRRKKIEDGYVELHGEWITIDEKQRRLFPPLEKEKAPRQVIINRNDNRRVYNIHHYHSGSQTSGGEKHPQLDQEVPKGLTDGLQGRKRMDAERPALENGARKKMLPGGKKKSLPPGTKPSLPPPPDTDSMEDR